MIRFKNRFHDAVVGATTRNLPKILKYLLSNRDNVDPENYQNAINDAFLFLSWTVERFDTYIIDLLLEQRCRIRMFDVCIHNNFRLFQYLETKKCISALDVMQNGLPALCQNEHLEFLKYIFENPTYMDIEDSISCIKSACYYASISGKFAVIPYILEQKPECVHNVDIHSVIYNEWIDIFELLMTYQKHIYSDHYYAFAAALRSKNEYFIKRLLEICSQDNCGYEIIHLQYICRIDITFIVEGNRIPLEEGKKRQEVLVKSKLRHLFMTLLKQLPCPNECIFKVISYLV